jgi:hypothetical protein
MARPAHLQSADSKPRTSVERLRDGKAKLKTCRRCDDLFRDCQKARLVMSTDYNKKAYEQRLADISAFKNTEIILHQHLKHCFVVAESLGDPVLHKQYEVHNRDTRRHSVALSAEFNRRKELWASA